MPKRGRHIVAVLAFEGVVLGDLSTPCEIFGRARDELGQPFYDVRVCGDAPSVDARWVRLAPPFGLSMLRRAHTIVVPGVERIEDSVSTRLLQALRREHKRGARIASVCSGAFVLAAAGLLDGLRATTHWRAAPELARRFPSIRVDADVLYVDEGALLTAAGAAAAFDLCLHMVRRDMGAKAAADIARIAVMPLERAGGQAQFILHEPPVHEGATIGAVLSWLEANLQRDLRLPAIARRAAMSMRTLSRRFHEQTGTTPAKWLARARVRRAQELLETTSLPLDKVATAVGFSSAPVLRERFVHIVGMSPVAYRKAFRGADVATP